MGMAASQARFLGLTARKSNLEYQGQQINEARLVLANQSSLLYNQVLTMKVPTPPNVENFNKIQYSFSRPGSGETCNINQVAAEYSAGNPTGKYTVQYTYKTNEIGFFKENDPSKAKYVTTLTATTWSISTPTGSQTLQVPAGGSPQEAAATQIAAQFSITASNIRYANVGTVDEPIYIYFNKAVLSTTPGDVTLSSYYQNGTYEKYSTTQYTGTTLERTQDNRIASIILSSADGGYALACSTGTVTDEVSYENAMHQYTYENALYQQKLSEINASIAIVQEQDRSLELSLKQLDTERNAVQTEMDAVSKVLEKNVEDTFKTFS